MYYTLIVLLAIAVLAVGSAPGKAAALRLGLKRIFWSLVPQSVAGYLVRRHYLRKIREKRKKPLDDGTND